MPVPPFAVTWMLPLALLKQVKLVATTFAIAGEFGAIILITLVAVQLFASVTVTVNVPAFNPLNTLLF